MKREADEHAAKIAKERARGNAEFAASEAAAAAAEWEKVYALRLEREEADRRAAGGDGAKAYTYAARAFRLPASAGDPMEFTQVGFEWFGKDSDADADAEAFALVREAVAACDVTPTATEMGDALIAAAGEFGLDGPFDRERFENEDALIYDTGIASAFFDVIVAVDAVFTEFRDGLCGPGSAAWAAETGAPAGVPRPARPPLGIQILGGEFHQMLPGGAVLPAEASQRFSMSHDNQR